MEGGTVLVLSGTEFGETAENVVVTVGDEICAIDSVTNTKIECTIPPKGKHHSISMEGKSSTCMYMYQ